MSFLLFTKTGWLRASGISVGSQPSIYVAQLYQKGIVEKIINKKKEQAKHKTQSSLLTFWLRASVKSVGRQPQLRYQARNKND